MRKLFIKEKKEERQFGHRHIHSSNALDAFERDRHDLYK